MADLHNGQPRHLVKNVKDVNPLRNLAIGLTLVLLRLLLARHVRG